MIAAAMDCQSCGHRNAEGSRFCAECGHPLAVEAHCPDCGATTDPGQKFCTACGSALPNAPRRREPSNPDLREYTPSYIQDRIRNEAMALAGERKQVTILFADITGSMELASQVDAEAWHDVMDGFFSLLCEGIQRFEGSVNKFTGDGIMALFGAPLAHEDHARRACYAAIHLRDELARYAGEVRREHGLNFSVRMGLNSGEVVVGAVGDDLNVDYTAIGNTVGLASRIEQLAEPGKAYLTADTAAMMEGWFELRDLGDFGIKGLAEPVRVFELVNPSSARSQVEATSRERGLTRFVGRTDELETLKAALAKAGEGVGQVVGIVADPGLGKSRLCWEFVQHCHAVGCEVNEGHGVAHGKRIPLLPVIEMMRSYFGIEDDDSDRSARDKIAGRLLLLDDEFKDLLPVLFDFLGVPDPERPPPSNPEARHRQLLATVRRLFQAGRTGRTVTLIEDLHWLDSGSDLFVENMVDAIAGTHNLVVLNFRPEYSADWMRKSCYRQIPLLPLGTEAIAEMLADLLGEDPSLDGLAELVHERTGGNPFFIEEVVQSLVGVGALQGRKGAYRLVNSVEEIAIPPTVQAVLAARIDRLPEREKALLQRASVIGRDFSEAVLTRVAGLGDQDLGDALRVLVAAEFVFERSLYPEAEYSFKHPLTEEVTYNSQLGDRRARTHAAVAEAITEVYSERLDEMAAVIANHWEHAGRGLDAARWNSRAARWAGLNHPREALTHWLRVRALLADAGDSPEALGLRVAACVSILNMGGWRLGMSEEDAMDVFRDGQRAAELLGDRRLEVAVTSAYANSVGFKGRVEQALALSFEARALAEELGDQGLLASTGPGFWLALRGRMREALEQMEEAIERARGRPELGREWTGFSPWAWTTTFTGIALLPEFGRLDEARASIEEGLQIALDHDDVETEMWARMGIGILAWYVGEPGDGLASARAALSLAERLGGTFSLTSTQNGLALAHLARDEYAEADAAADRAYELATEAQSGLQYKPMSLLTRSEAATRSGDPRGGLEFADEALAEACACGSLSYELGAEMSRARALIRLDHLEEGEASLARVRELISETSMVYSEAHCLAEQAEIARRRGDRATQEDDLRAAEQLFAQMGAHGWAAKAAAERAALPV